MTHRPTEHWPSKVRMVIEQSRIKGEKPEDHPSLGWWHCGDCRTWHRYGEHGYELPGTVGEYLAGECTGCSQVVVRGEGYRVVGEGVLVCERCDSRQEGE